MFKILNVRKVILYRTKKEVLCFKFLYEMTIFSVNTYILVLYLSLLRFHIDELLISRVYILNRIVQCTCEIISTRSS